MTVPTAVLATAAVLAATTACSSDEPAAPTPTPTYNLEPRAVRPDEQALQLPATRDDDTSFLPIGLTTGTATLVGSHAEFAAKGQYVRVRLVVTNVGRSSVLFNARRQQLVLDDGRPRTPDPQAMLIKRQPGSFDLGAGVRVEFDLYYDVPKTAKATALLVYGGPTLTDMKDLEGTKIALP